MEKVNGYMKKVHGKMVHVKGYFRKNHDKVSANDIKVDKANLRKARRSKRRR